jgi:folate-binding protein YgfZ
MTAPARLDRKIVRVSGPDARSFLQGLLTQDIERLDEGEAAYAALLSPQGKVIADMFLHAADPPVYLLDVDASRADRAMQLLTRYKLRAQVSVAELNEHSVAWSEQRFERACADPRLPTLGWRRIVHRDEAAPLAEEAYRMHRIALGVPDLARDAQPEEVFAGEALLEELNGVAFDKGCFVGQENVSRMKRRATTRRKFCPVVFEGEAIEYGAPMLAGEAEIGSIRTGADGRAIALLRLDRAIDAAATGRSLTAAGREIRLDPPPWLILPRREDAPG